MSLRFVVGGFVILIATAAAFAFGTIHGLGQNTEHERITRHALACVGGTAPDRCFEGDMLDLLAGKKGGVGAVGLPDVTMVTSAQAHCDSGDHFDIAGYPQTRGDAQAHLAQCRAWTGAKLDEAVRDPAALVDRGGPIDDSLMPSFVSCKFGAGKDRAKSNVLEAFGVLLHASQDFYSHTNWVDHSDSPENPPGLGSTGPAPWLALRTNARAVPAGLISGCFKMLPERAFCNSRESDKLHRAKHEFVNKDKGDTDPHFGGTGTQRRRVDGNFRRAVEAAILDTRDKWATFGERPVATWRGAPR